MMREKIGEAASIPGLGRFPGKVNGNPIHSLLGKSHGQSSPMVYSPWGHKESDMTKHVVVAKPKRLKMDQTL